MSQVSDETVQIAHEFDGDACDFCDRYKKNGLSRSSRLLLNFMLDDEEVRGRSMLDLGCGAGGFSLELLKQGASSAMGIDISPNMIESASRLAGEYGLEGRARFQVGNAATAELPSSDIVIMDKVLCCYSEWEPLLKNAMSASRNMIGFIVPRDEGLAKWPFRLGVYVSNSFQRRRNGVRFYLHPLGLVDKTLRDSGFIARKKQGSRFWLVFLYARPGNSSS